MSNQLDFVSLPNRPKPRKKGITVVWDYFMPAAEAKSMLEVGAEAIDYVKFIHAGLGLGASLPKNWIREKCELYRAHGIKTYPGGVPFQVALVQDKVAEYFDWVRKTGFDGVEIAEDAMPFSVATPKKREDYIRMALDKGLFVDTELGKKAPDEPLDLNEAHDTMMRDLELGVAHVVVERAELNYYLDKDPAPLVNLVNKVGMENVLIEPGPFGWPTYHDWSFKTFGPDVNLSNIEKDELLYVEFSRRGLSRFGYGYFDQFKNVAR